MSVQSNGSSRARRTMFRFVLLLVVGGVLTFASITIVQSQDQSATATPASNVTISETGTVQTGTLTITLDAVGSMTPVQDDILSFGASAAVTEVDVQVGDQVHAGDVLARIETTDADARIRTAQIQLQQAQASLDSLQSPPTQIQIDLAQAQVTLAQAQLYAASTNGTTANSAEIAQLQAQLARNQLWQAQINRDIRVAQQVQHSGTSVTWVQQQQFDQSVNQAQDSVTIADMNAQDAANSGASSSSITSAQASVANAQASLQSLLTGATADQIRQAQIQVNQAQLSVQTAQDALNNYTLIAPFDGVVAEQSLIVGVRPPSAGAITLINTQNYTIDLSIAESDVVNVRVGQPVSIHLEAFPNATVTGAITRLDTTPTLSGQLVTYNAQVTVNDLGGAAVRPGMSATATITLRQLENVLLVPNRFISTDTTTGANTVNVETAPGEYNAVPVTIGERSTADSQILSGLQAGQTIVIITRPSASATQQSGGLSLFGGGGAPPGGFTGGGGNFGGRTGTGGNTIGGGAPPGG